VTHAGAFVDHLDPRIFKRWEQLNRVAPGCLDHFDAAFDHRFHNAGIIWRCQRWQNGNVHAKGLVRHVLAARNFVCEIFRRLLGEPGDNAEAASIGNSGRHFGKADIVHATLDDRMLDAEHFGDGGFHMRDPPNVF